MKRLAEWQYGKPHEKKLLERCRDIVVGIVPGAQDKVDTMYIIWIKGCETDEEKAKHAAAKRWVSAANNWGNLGEWCFHVCREPLLLGKELEHI